MAQSFCLGVEHGPNYNITDDWELSRMYNIYSALVNNTIEVRVKQETDYLKVSGPSVFRSCVGSRSYGKRNLFRLPETTKDTETTLNAFITTLAAIIHGKIYLFSQKHTNQGTILVS